MAINKNIQEVMPPKHTEERHIACLAACDTSLSMKNVMADLNQGLVEMGQAFDADTLARAKVDVSVISFSADVKTELGFRSAEEYTPPVLTADSSTSLNMAINASLDALEKQKALYRHLKITYYRPWYFLLTDGFPTDPELNEATRERMRQFIREKKVNFIPMGIGPNADLEHLRSYYPPEAESKPVLKATKDNFKDAFVWFSNSVIKTTYSDINAEAVETRPLPSAVTLTLGV